MPASSRTMLHPSISNTAETLSDMGFTAAQLADVRRVWITPHDGNLVYTLNGDTPTATQGHIFVTGTTYEINEAGVNLSAIRQGASDVAATVEVESYI